MSRYADDFSQQNNFSGKSYADYADRSRYTRAGSTRTSSGRSVDASRSAYEGRASASTASRLSDSTRMTRYRCNEQKQDQRRKIIKIVLPLFHFVQAVCV
jgi:hypothetical protein